MLPSSEELARALGVDDVQVINNRLSSVEVVIKIGDYAARTTIDMRTAGRTGEEIQQMSSLAGRNLNELATELKRRVAALRSTNVVDGSADYDAAYLKAGVITPEEARVRLQMAENDKITVLSADVPSLADPMTRFEAIAAELYFDKKKES